MLELQNISFGVTEDNGTGSVDKEILNDISLTIEDNKFVVITGPNGGGKSTLAKIIAGIEKPTSGRILLDGVDITDNLTITITNTRDNIPITGVDDHDTYNWVIYLLVAIAGIAVVGTGIFLWKKKDEFVEE